MIVELFLLLAEGWHSGIKEDLERTSQNVYKQIAALKKEYLARMFRLNQILGGHPPNRPKAKYAALNTRLKNIALRYAETDRLTYLRSIAHAT